MKYEDIAETTKFKELLALISEEERSGLEEAIRVMVTEFDEKVLKPLESLKKP